MKPEVLYPTQCPAQENTTVSGAGHGPMVEDFCLASYEEIWQRQKALVAQRLDDLCGDMLLIGEHSPVLTLGRGFHDENLLAKNDEKAEGGPAIPSFAIERGGDITYHGPGQVVAYPILMLRQGRRDLHQYLRLLEEAVIRTLADFGLQGVRNPGLTGVWIQDKAGELKKVCAIGVAVKRWVTYHGLSLNVNCDLSPYLRINPCGLSASVMSHMSEFSGTPLDVQAVKTTLTGHLINTLPFDQSNQDD